VRTFGSDVSVCPYICPSIQTLGEGEGSPKATRPGEENVIFSWREIAPCFWATSAAKRLFYMPSVEGLNLRKNIKKSINGKKKFKRILSFFLVGGEKYKLQNLPSRTSS